MTRFLLGVGVGAALGILLAPASGEETREQVTRRFRELARVPEQKLRERVENLADRAREEAGDVGSTIGRRAAEAAVQSATSSLLGKKQPHTA